MELPDPTRQVVCLNPGFSGKCHRTFHSIAKFTHIAGKWIMHQKIQGFRRKTVDCFAETEGKLLHEACGQHFNIFSPVSEEGREFSG